MGSIPRGKAQPLAVFVADEAEHLLNGYFAQHGAVPLDRKSAVFLLTFPAWKALMMQPSVRGAAILGAGFPTLFGVPIRVAADPRQGPEDGTDWPMVQLMMEPSMRPKVRRV